jgi:4-amino-4-deoxy-L-arabinose transferase-like glycosyltransferase
LWVIAGVLVARVIYLTFLSPWELVGDEAYYWEWSRHLDWCYYEKGPAQAFLIAPFVRLLGDHEWAVRLPMALLSAACAWVVLRLAVRASGGSGRAGWIAVVLFCVTPAFVANAQLCTQDAAMIFVWAVLSACGLTLTRRWEAGEARLRDWATPAAWLGVGFLFKQSVLLFLPSLLIYAWVRRRRLTWDRRVVAHVVVAAAVFAVFTLPMIVWNARHGWPTLAHTLGHLGAGGDEAVKAAAAHYTPMWFLSLVGAQVGAIGPATLVLMGVATWRAMRRRSDDDDGRWPVRLWLICCGWPSIAFFVALSAWKPVIGSWPFPAYVALVALVGEWATGNWEARGANWTRFAPWYRFAVVYGLGGCVLLCFPNWLVHVPGIGRSVGGAVMRKMSGHRAHAQQLQAARESVRAREHAEPIVVARYYMNAALDAFYLPDHPTVFCAGTPFGKRPTAYDFWPATDLTAAAALRGRSAVLDGSGPRPWDYALIFDHVEPPAGGAISVGTGYGGVRARTGGGGVVESDP